MGDAHRVLKVMTDPPVKDNLMLGRKHIRRIMGSLTNHVQDAHVVSSQNLKSRSTAQLLGLHAVDESFDSR